MKFSALSAATTPLNEGETPAAQDVTVTAVTQTVEEYGAWLQFTEKLLKTGIDPAMVAFSELLGEQVGLTIDTLVRDQVVATTNVVYPGSHDERTDITANLEDRMSATLLLKMLRELHNANAKPFDDGKYIGIISPNTWYDMMQDSTIQNIMQNAKNRGDDNPLVRGFVAELFDIKFYMTTNAKYYPAGGAHSNDVHATMVFGRDAVGIGGLAGMIPGAISADQKDPNTGKVIKPVTLIVTPPETPSKEDALRQRGTIGWKTTFAVKMLDEKFLVKAEHGVSA